MAGDIIWTYDMIGELDVFPHNLAAGSPLIVGDMLFAITGQGVDEGHINIPAPKAPSFLALDITSGESDPGEDEEDIILADLPENPVGAVWETIRGALPDLEEWTESVALEDCWNEYRRLLGLGRFTPFSAPPLPGAEESGAAEDLETLRSLGYIQ